MWCNCKFKYVVIALMSQQWLALLKHVLCMMQVLDNVGDFSINWDKKTQKLDAEFLSF